MDAQGTEEAVVLPVEGMTCASCAGRIERVLRKLDGIHDATVNLATEKAKVVYDPGHTDPEHIAEAIEASGFHVPPDLRRFKISGMTCASCAGRIEKALRKLPGVITAQVNLASEVATLAILPGGVTNDSIIDAVRQAGYDAALASSAAAERSAEHEVQRLKSRRELWTLVAAALLTTPLMAPMLLSPFGVHWMLPGWVQLALATPVQFIAGARFYRGALGALKAKSANMDVLVALGTSSAFALSVVMLSVGGHLYFEGAAAIITFVRFGKWLEARAKHSTTSAIRALMELRPETARVRRNGIELLVPPDAVGKGEIVVVRPGERLPIDGDIVEGQSQLNESLLTGESLPQDKGVGDAVTGGSINGDGLLAISATRVGHESTLARIVAMVENAQAAKAPIQQTVDKVSAVFVPVVIVAASLTFLGWMLAGASVEGALINAVSVLVIACPCALGLATPAALMVGTGSAARAGILIADAQALEVTHKVDVVVLDKTGTLTEGNPIVREVLAKDGDGLLALAAAAQHGSEHPLAEAIRRASASTSLSPLAATDFQALPGKGVQATVGGKAIVVGSPRLMSEMGLEDGAWHSRAGELEAQGMTVVWLAEDGELRGGIAIGDAIRSESIEAIAKLKSAGVEAIMLTGDNQSAADAIGQELAIDLVIAEVMPADKAVQIEALQEAGRCVAMVGDGVNDAPALAAADVGFAMSSGSDVAMHTAGITLMRPSPLLVADAISISRATTRKIHQNLFWAFAYNSIGIPLAALGFLSPMIAGGAMALSSVSVLSNALLLRRWRPSS